MIYLFFIEMFKALSSTKTHSCLKCSVRAARRHKGTPELELVRKQIFCPAKPSKISFSLLLLLFWIRAKSYISKCFHMVEFYRREIIFCLIYQSSSFLCKMHILKLKAFYSYIFVLAKPTTLGFPLSPHSLFLCPVPILWRRAILAKYYFLDRSCFFKREKERPDSGKQNSLWTVKIVCLHN